MVSLRSIVSLGAVVTLALTLLAVPAAASEAAAALELRKTLTVGAQPGAGVGYQLPLLVGEGPAAAGADFHLEGNAWDFPHDVRFVGADGALLPHWVESVSGAAPARVAQVWVRLSGDLDAGDVTLSCLYGGELASASDGGATFEFFDDFDTIDESRWLKRQEQGGHPIPANSYAISNGALLLRILQTDRTPRLSTIEPLDLPGYQVITRTRVMYGNSPSSASNYSRPSLTVGPAAAIYARYNYSGGSSGPICAYLRSPSFLLQVGGSRNAYCPPSAMTFQPLWDIWFHQSIKLDYAAGVVVQQINGEQIVHAPGEFMGEPGDDFIHIHAWGWWLGHRIEKDYVAVARFTYPEPGLVAVSAEEPNAGADLESVLAAIGDGVDGLHAAGALNRGQSNALLATLASLHRALDRERAHQALNALGALVNQVSAFEQGGILAPADAAALRDLAATAAELIVAE